MDGDGNGWAAGPAGGRQWGRFGAAGLFLLADPRAPRLLMQHRALWTNIGGTWALPGGARDSHETAVEAALREAHEETGIAPADVEVAGERVTAGPFAADPGRPELAGGWTYTTVVAATASGDPLATEANNESLELRWVRLDEVEELPLMPAFAAALPGIRAALPGVLPAYFAGE